MFADMIRYVIYMDEDMASGVIRCDERILINLQILVEQHGRTTVEIEGCRCHLPKSTAKCRGIFSNTRTKELREGFDNELRSLFIRLGSNTIDGLLRSANFVGQPIGSRITVSGIRWSRHVKLL